MSNSIEINGKKIGVGHPTYIIAEISANHNQNIQAAIDLIEIAAECGADAVKIQTYTPDTMTLDCKSEYFLIGKGSIWEGKNLHDLYKEAYTPWNWLPKLQEVAKKCGITIFSTPFDASSVDFLEEHNVPAHKIASFELTDHPLLKKVAKTGKPVILSTGMGSLVEICRAVETLKQNGCSQLALLKCTSAYPAPPEEANLNRIPHMQQIFNVPVGLSDHTMGSVVPALAVTVGASIIEKHFTKSRSIAGPDSSFSLEPHELKEMVEAARIAESALGIVTYELTDKEISSRKFRRSIFVAKDIKKGEAFTTENIRVVRPSDGIEPKHYDKVLGKFATEDLAFGIPLSWNLVS